MRETHAAVRAGGVISGGSVGFNAGRFSSSHWRPLRLTSELTIHEPLSARAAQVADYERACLDGLIGAGES
jgi:hypothetical protein